ncbi:hypothetical protein AB1E18_015736 [Capra hircus]
MPQPRQSTRLVQKTLTRLPSEGRAGRVPTSSEGRANAQPDDSSGSRLLKPEFDVSEDAVNKAPHPTLSPRRLGKGAQPQTSPGRPRQVSQLFCKLTGEFLCRGLQSFWRNRLW